MNHDFIRLANEMASAHARGIAFRLPAMTMRQLDTLIALLELAAIPAPTVH